MRKNDTFFRDFCKLIFRFPRERLDQHIKFFAARAQQSAMPVVGCVSRPVHGGLAVFWQCQQGLVAPASNWPLKLDKEIRSMPPWGVVAS